MAEIYIPITSLVAHSQYPETASYSFSFERQQAMIDNINLIFDQIPWGEAKPLSLSSTQTSEGNRMIFRVHNTNRSYSNTAEADWEAEIVDRTVVYVIMTSN